MIIFVLSSQSIQKEQKYFCFQSKFGVFKTQISSNSPISIYHLIRVSKCLNDAHLLKYLDVKFDLITISSFAIVTIGNNTSDILKKFTSSIHSFRLIIFLMKCVCIVHKIEGKKNIVFKQLLYVFKYFYFGVQLNNLLLPFTVTYNNPLPYNNSRQI